MGPEGVLTACPRGRWPAGRVEGPTEISELAAS